MGERLLQYEGSVRSRAVEVIWERPDIHENLTLADQRRALSILSHPSQNMPQIERSEGRNVWLQASRPIDHNYTYLQLSGGFYRRLTPTNLSGLNTKNDAILYPPSKANFAKDHRNAVATQWIDERGKLQTTSRDYVPTGGYTQADALLKARDTYTIEQELANLGETELRVPRVLFVYSFPDVPDIVGKPISGICFAVPDPSLIFHNYVNSFTSPERIDSRNEFNFADALCGQMWSAGYGIRKVHDLLGRFHGQANLGNISHASSENVRSVFIKDWHTAHKLPASHEAQQAARILELMKLYRSPIPIISLLDQLKMIDTDDIDGLLVSSFQYMLSGYIDGGGSTEFITLKRSEVSSVIQSMIENEGNGNLMDKIRFCTRFFSKVFQAAGRH